MNDYENKHKHKKKKKNSTDLVNYLTSQKKGQR